MTKEKSFDLKGLIVRLHPSVTETEAGGLIRRNGAMILARRSVGVDWNQIAHELVTTCGY